MHTAPNRNLCSLMDSTQGNTKKKLKTNASVITGVFIFAVMFAFGIHRCPLQFFFGVPCALCGMTRAFMALARGDVSGAFHQHPLWPTVPFIAGFFALCYLDIIHPSRKIYDTVVYSSVVLLFVCFIIRHIIHSPVVEINFASSFVGSIIKCF